MKYSQYYIASAILLLLTIITVFIYFSITDITILPQKSKRITPPVSDPQKVKEIYIGVVSRFSPNLIYEGYQPIMNYLTRVTPFRFRLKLSNSYEETIRQLDQGDVQAAFLGTYIYLKMRKNHPLKCILKPLNSHFEPYFHSVIVTRSDSPFHSITDLKGTRLALPSPFSFSGNWLTRYEFKKYGLKISDLDSVHYFDHHHTVIYQVLCGNFDVGVVKDRVAAEFTSQGIRCIAFSEQIPGSPIVVKSDLDSTIINALQTALLKINVRQPENAKLVQDWDPEFAYGFTIARDADYDHLESIMKSLEEKP
jgi:phosphonate transport system substrate-binding protein